MRFSTAILALILLVGCVHSPTSNPSFDSISSLVTPDLINKHLSNGASPVGAPKVRHKKQQMNLTFGRYCKVRIARGKELLTDEKYEQMKSNLFVIIAGSSNQDTNSDPSCPQIGFRALVQGSDTTIDFHDKRPTFRC
jgi:hypothetical protein